jgi:hypothetical protein
VVDINENQIRAAWSLANDARRKNIRFRQENLRERSRIFGKWSSSHEKILASLLTKEEGGADELNKIRSQTQADVRRLLQKQRDTVARQSSMAEKALHHVVESRREATEHVISLRNKVELDLNFNFVVLDKSIFIWPSGDGIDLTEYHYEPWNNFVKFNAEWETAVGLADGGG